MDTKNQMSRKEIENNMYNDEALEPEIVRDRSKSGLNHRQKIKDRSDELKSNCYWTTQNNFKIKLYLVLSHEIVE